MRRPVPLGSRSGGEPLESLFEGYRALVCGSGTEALALALSDAARRSGIQHPEVILPAYGCPDLVSASLHAGVRPRLVDTASGQWGFDLEQLAQRISADTIGLVAVNLLGAGDQGVRLREIARARGIVLIQDSAQHLPTFLPARWQGDYVVFSFGRGKPLNLLRGGLLLHARSEPILSRDSRPLSGASEWLLSSRMAGFVFNVATRPGPYGMLRHLPAAEVGITRYWPLLATRTGSAALGAQLRSGLAGYRTNPGYDASIWHEAYEEWSAAGVTLLSCAEDPSGGNLRLRLGLLAPDATTCAAIVGALGERGATRMYGVPLPDLPGIPREVALQGPFPNALDLALRLFTLPTHSCVTPRAVEQARKTVRAVLLRNQ